jgi:electron transport complex protein RnfD
MSFFTVSSSPHISTHETTSRIMLDVIIALIPAGVVSVWLCSG